MELVVFDLVTRLYPCRTSYLRGRLRDGNVV